METSYSMPKNDSHDLTRQGSFSITMVYVLQHRQKHVVYNYMLFSLHHWRKFPTPHVCVNIHNLSVSSCIYHDIYLEVRQPCLRQFLYSLLHRQAFLSPPPFSLEESWNYRCVFSCLTLHWFWRSEFSTSHLQDFIH